MPRVFISFRKVDERWMRHRTYQALTSRFAASQFFKSGESVPPGSDFAQILMEQAKSCEVMLILIGSRWLDASDKTGRRLIDRDGDWVRREIATSISAGNHVVPVLLGDATILPEPAQLPPDIAQIGRLQFLRVQETHLNDALDDFVASVARLLPDLRAATAPASERSGAPAEAEARSGCAERPAGHPAGRPPASTVPTTYQEARTINNIREINGRKVRIGDVIINPEQSALDTMRRSLSHDDVVERIKAARWLAQDRYPEAVHDVTRRLRQEDCGEAGSAGGDDAVQALTALAKIAATQNPLLESRVNKALGTARRGGLGFAPTGRQGGPR